MSREKSCFKNPPKIIKSSDNKIWKKWSKEELDLLKENFDKMTYSELAILLGRNRESLKKKANNDLGLFKIIDLMAGDRFGKLVVVKKLTRKNTSGGYFYLCKCDCGEESEVVRTNLTSGSIKSCGCGKTDSNSLPPGQATYNWHFGSFKKSAKKRGISFDLNMEQFMVLVVLDCDYCGEPAPLKNLYFDSDGNLSKSREKHFLRKKTLKNAWIHINSIDRVDSDKGYTFENCVPSCIPCNWFKSDRNVSDFIEHAYKIVTFQESKKANK